jgi:Sulfate permease family
MARALPDGDPLSEATGPRFSRIASGLRPGLCALRAHDGPALRSDLMAGLTVAAFLVPQVLAYAGVAGLPAVTGLWAAIAALGCYALLGSSRQLSLGPRVDHSPADRVHGGATRGQRPAPLCRHRRGARRTCWAGWPDSASWPTCCPDRSASAT